MPTYEFTARDTAGKTQKGTLSSVNSVALTSELRQRGWLILDVKPAAQKTFSLPNLNPAQWLPVTTLDVEVGFQQISSMLRSGLTLLNAIKTAGEQARRPKMAAIWQQVHQRIEEGASFTDALAQFPRCFPVFAVQLVRAGEQSGTLEIVLSRAAEQLERSRTLRFTLLNALIYPVIVLVMAIGVSMFMMLGVIPKIEKFLVGRGKRLPAITQALLDVSTAFREYAIPIGIFTVAAIIAFICVYRWPPGRLFIDTLSLRLPLFGKLIRTAATAIFARTLALLLDSGITLLEALQTVERLVPNAALSRHVASIRETIIQGGSLASPLSRDGYFMPMLSRMAVVGESTGTLDRVLTEVADFHEKQLAASVRRLSVLIEPAIIVVVGGIVGFVYIAFFVALFSLAG
ncbi:MAG TPA: type II secretion system F family protein [Planctomycetota bacterium]|nr:type II secretion system F family protein [Planctomycetota bacterium]